MAYPRTPGGLFPLTTAPTGNNAGGLYPLPAVLSDAIRSLAPTAYWKLDEASGDLADAMSGGYTATVTGSPTYGVALPSPVGRGITFPSGAYATSSGSIPTPTASMSILAVFSTSDATAANRYLAGRSGGGGQVSWGLRMGTAHNVSFLAFQADGNNHAIATASGVANDGALHVVVGSFDGTTIRAGRDGNAAGTSASLTGSWKKDSTAGVTVSSLNGSLPFLGTQGLVAYWADRVITDAERMWINAIARGV